MRKIAFILLLMCGTANAQVSYLANDHSALTGTCSTAPTFMAVGTACFDTVSNQWTYFNGKAYVPETPAINTGAPLTFSGGKVGIGPPYAATSYTAHGVIVGEGISNLSVVSPCAAGSFLLGQGSLSDPICSTLILPNASIAGDLFVSTAPNTMGRLPIGANGFLLSSNGTSPVWNTVGTAIGPLGGDLSGTLPNPTVAAIGGVAVQPAPNPATSGDLSNTATGCGGSSLYCDNSAHSQGVLYSNGGSANVAFTAIPQQGQLLWFNAINPAFTYTPTLGVATTHPGTLGLAAGVGGGAVWKLASGATSAWTLTSAATAPLQGDLQTFSNATGQMASVPDVATGAVLASQGTNTAPAYLSAPAISGANITNIPAANITGNVAITVVNSGNGVRSTQVASLPSKYVVSQDTLATRPALPVPPQQRPLPISAKYQPLVP